MGYREGGNPGNFFEYTISRQHGGNYIVDTARPFLSSSLLHTISFTCYQSLILKSFAQPSAWISR